MEQHFPTHLGGSTKPPTGYIIIASVTCVSAAGFQRFQPSTHMLHMHETNPPLHSAAACCKANPPDAHNLFSYAIRVAAVAAMASALCMCCCMFPCAVVCCVARWCALLQCCSVAPAKFSKKASPIGPAGLCVTV
jgi:hypothetical protein